MDTTNPTFKGQNVEIFCDEKLPSFEPEKLFEILDQIQQEFFEDFNIKNKTLKTPVKFYLFRTRDKWKQFNDENKTKLSNYCPDKQSDYPFLAEDVLNVLIPKLLKQNFNLKKDEQITKGISKHYCNEIYFSENKDFLEKHWFLRTFLNPTFMQDKVFSKTIEAEFVTKFFLEQKTPQKLFEKNAVENNLTKVKDYYCKKFETEKIPKKLEDAKNVDELLWFLDQNIVSGYLSKDGKVFINQFKDIHEKSISQTPEEILKNHVGTCADYAILVNEFLKNKGFETKIFFVANHEKPLKKENSYKDLQGSHYRVFYKNKKGLWTQVECASREFQGQHTFKTLGEGLTKGFSYYFYQKHFEIFEVKKIPIHASFVQLFDNAKNSKQLKVSGKTIKDFKIDYKPLKQEQNF